MRAASRLLILLVLLLPLFCAQQRSPAGGASFVDSGVTEGEFCHRNLDCPGGRCEAGICFYPDAARPRADGGQESEDGGLTSGDADGRDARPRDVGHADAGRADSGPDCIFDTDCPIPHICGRDGTCIPECVEERDCPDDQVCHRGGCRAPGGPCLESGDCLGGEVCHLRRCRPEPDCLFSDQCEPGQRCVDGQCVDLGPDAGTGPPLEDGGVDPGCEPRQGRYGDLCECPEQCATELCLDVAVLDWQPVCTSECGVRAPCPGIDLCMPVGDGRQVCVPNDSGRPCRGGFDCVFYCLSDPRGGATCSTPCDNASQCPQSWGCGPVMSDTGPQRLCLPAGGVCSASAECPGQRCLPRSPGSLVGFCTLDCRDARDCPAGWSCCAVYDPVLNALVRICYDGPVCPI